MGSSSLAGFYEANLQCSQLNCMTEVVWVCAQDQVGPSLAPQLHINRIFSDYMH